MRHVIERNGVEIEMMPISPGENTASPETVRSQDPTYTQLLMTSTFEPPPSIREDTFKDSAMRFIHRRKAAFSPQKTAIHTANLAPTILMELSHNIPGLGAVIGSAAMLDNLVGWRKFQKHSTQLKELLKIHLNPKNKDTDFKRFSHAHPGHPEILANTFLFVLAQLDRKSKKAEQVMVGKALQILGSGLTILGLVTHGVTAIPGIMLGAGGTAIKLRITLRSASNFIQKKYKKELSMNRELHARYLYGLTLRHLVNSGSYTGDLSRSQEAITSMELIDNIPGDPRGAEAIAADFVGSLVDLKNIEYFVDNGFWDIMVGIKT